MKGVKTLMISDLALLIGWFSSDVVLSMAVKGLRWLSRLRASAAALFCPRSLPRDGRASFYCRVRYTMYDTRCTIHNIRYTLYDTQCTIHAVRYTLYDTRCTIHDAGQRSAPSSAEWTAVRVVNDSRERFLWYISGGWAGRFLPSEFQQYFYCRRLVNKCLIPSSETA